MALSRGRVRRFVGEPKKKKQRPAECSHHHQASMCVHVHVHAQPLSHPAGMAMLQVWSLVGRWHSQCGGSGPKIDSRPPTNVNQQYLTVYSRLSGMVVDICRGLILCLRLNPEAMQRGSSVIAGRKHYLSSKRKQKALLKFYKEAWLR